MSRPITSIPVKLPISVFLASADARARLLVLIASHGRGTTACIASVAYMARLLGVGVNTIRQALADLQDAGLITAEGDGWKATPPRAGDKWVNVRPDAIERAATSGTRTGSRDAQTYALMLHQQALRPGRPVRQADLAAMLGTDKRTINASLKRLTRAGLVSPTRATNGAPTEWTVYQAPTSDLTSADLLPEPSSTTDAFWERVDESDRCNPEAPTDAFWERPTDAFWEPEPVPYRNTRARENRTEDLTATGPAAARTPAGPLKQAQPSSRTVAEALALPDCPHDNFRHRCPTCRRTSASAEGNRTS